MAETQYGRITKMVAGAGIPTFGPGVGTELHHTERVAGSRERVTMTTGTYKWVDQFSITGTCARMAQHEHACNGRNA